MSDIKILIADDHEVVRRGLAMVLNLEAGFQVVGEAADGVAALAEAKRLNPDVVLLDMKMPEMSGRQAAIQIKALYPSIRIIILSGAEVDDDVFDTLDSGVDGYVLKDISPDELARAIQMVMRGQQYIHADITRALLKRVRKPDNAPKDYRLTPREMEVLQFLATSATYQEIGVQLSISEETVRSHAKAILAKLEQPNRRMAVLAAVKLALIILDKE